MRYLVFRQSDGFVIGHFDSIDQARDYRSMLVPGGDVDAVLGIKQEEAPWTGARFVSSFSDADEPRTLHQIGSGFSRRAKLA